MRILAPYALVPIARTDAHDDVRTVRHRDLVDQAAVDASDGFTEGEYGVLMCSEYN